MMVSVGLGPESTVVICVIGSGGEILCNVVMTKQQVNDHIQVLARHAAVLPSDVATKLVEHSQMN